MSSLMLAGLGVAVSAIAARFIIQSFRQIRSPRSQDHRRLLLTTEVALNLK